MALPLKLLICLLFVACGTSTESDLDGVDTTTKTTPGTTTTVAPPGTATTEAPPGTATTVAPPGTATTVAPPGTATTEAPPGTATTEAPPGTATTEAPGPCASNPCRDGATCEETLNKRICLCLAGESYDDDLQQCISAKVFPGDLVYEKRYEEGMADKTTAIFRTTAAEIVTRLNKVYENDETAGYHGSIVTKLSKPGTKADTLVATVDIMFSKDSEVTSEDVKNKTESVGTFTVNNLCDSEPCDTMTTACNNTDGGFICECLDKYVKTDFSDRVCVACPNGKKVVNGECADCDFGYSGFNCDDNWQLVLVIVGSVLGVLLLITIILLPVVAVMTKKKSKKSKTANYEKPYSNPAPTKTPQFSNGVAAPRPTPVQAAPAGRLSGFGGNGVPRIPRATTNDNWDRNTNLEMVPSNSRQNLIPAGRNSRRFDDQEDTNPYSRPMKPQNNPYAVGRPQVNPYASNQGHSNPYFRN